SNAGRKSQNLIDDRLRLRLQYQLHNNSECNLLPMHEGMRPGCGGKAVVNRMSRSQPGGFKAQPRKQSVGLDQALQGGRDILRPKRLESTGPVGEQSLIAKLRQSKGTPRRGPAAHV